MMAVLFLLSPLLLLLGTVAGQVVLEEDVCLSVGNATEGNFTVETDPGTYQPNTTYLGKAALGLPEPPRLSLTPVLLLKPGSCDILFLFFKLRSCNVLFLLFKPGRCKILFLLFKLGEL